MARGSGSRDHHQVRRCGIQGVVFGDGSINETQAFGLFGGKVGSINEMEFRFADGRRYKPSSKEIDFRYSHAVRSCDRWRVAGAVMVTPV